MYLWAPISVSEEEGKDVTFQKTGFNKGNIYKMWEATRHCKHLVVSEQQEALTTSRVQAAEWAKFPGIQRELQLKL